MNTLDHVILKEDHQHIRNLLADTDLHKLKK